MRHLVTQVFCPLKIFFAKIDWHCVLLFYWQQYENYSELYFYPFQIICIKIIIFQITSPKDKSENSVLKKSSKPLGNKNEDISFFYYDEEK